MLPTTTKYNAGIRKGEPKAFEALFYLLNDALVRYALLFVKQQQEAEEIVQESFLKLWDKRKMVDAGFNLKAYLFKSVHNQALNYLRHLEIVALHEKHQAETHKNHEEAHAPHPFLKHALYSAIAELPKRTQLVFRLSRLNGYKHKEIAQKLSISEKTVEVQVRKARLILQDKLKDYYNEL